MLNEINGKCFQYPGFTVFSFFVQIKEDESDYCNVVKLPIPIWSDVYFPAIRDDNDFRRAVVYHQGASSEGWLRILGNVSKDQIYHLAGAYTTKWS